MVFKEDRLVILTDMLHVNSNLLSLSIKLQTVSAVVLTKHDVESTKAIFSDLILVITCYRFPNLSSDLVVYIIIEFNDDFTTLQIIHSRSYERLSTIHTFSVFRFLTKREVQYTKDCYILFSTRNRPVNIIVWICWIAFTSNVLINRDNLTDTLETPVLKNSHIVKQCIVLNLFISSENIVGLKTANFNNVDFNVIWSRYISFL